MESEKTLQCVEALCQCGCDAVRAAIRALEADLPLVETEGLSPREREMVLNELKAIMAVYDR